MKRIPKVLNRLALIILSSYLTACGGGKDNGDKGNSGASSFELSVSQNNSSYGRISSNPSGINFDLGYMDCSKQYPESKQYSS